MFKSAKIDTLVSIISIFNQHSDKADVKKSENVHKNISLRVFKQKLQSKDVLSIKK